MVGGINQSERQVASEWSLDHIYRTIVCTVSKKHTQNAGPQTHQILHACCAGFIDALQIFEDEVCVAVDD